MTSAAARLSAGDTTFLDQGSHGWKVSAAGCRPVARDEPFECELED
jgi:hypothetical protein